MTVSENMSDLSTSREGFFIQEKKCRWRQNLPAVILKLQKFLILVFFGDNEAILTLTGKFSPDDDLDSDEAAA